MSSAKVFLIFVAISLTAAWGGWVIERYDYFVSYAPLVRGIAIGICVVGIYFSLAHALRKWKVKNKT